MTRLTVNIPNDSDITFIKELLDRVGFVYEVEAKDNGYVFSEAELDGFDKTRQDFLDGKTTGRSWAEVKEDLNRAFNHNT
jgi:hypothetical protein